VRGGRPTSFLTARLQDFVHFVQRPGSGLSLALAVGRTDVWIKEKALAGTGGSV
jgi:hypothetical protein